MLSSLIALAAAQATAPPSGTPPTPPRQIGGTITTSDYPPAALRYEEQGTTSVQITVGPNGRVSGCTVLASSGSSALDSATCQLIVGRFRYAPATSNGRPTEADVTRRVVWRIPEGPSMMFAQGRFTWTVVASGAGATECRIEQIGTAFAQFDTGQCRKPNGDRMIAFEQMGAGHPATRVTHILSLLPEGEAATLPRLPGTPFAEWVAQVEVAPEGRVTACIPVSQQGAVPAYVSTPYKLGCQSLMGRTVFAATSTQEPRRARIGSAVYVQVMSPGAR
jgi:protein TonB